MCLLPRAVSWRDLGGDRLPPSGAYFQALQGLQRVPGDWRTAGISCPTVGHPQGTGVGVVGVCLGAREGMLGSGKCWSPLWAGAVPELSFLSPPLVEEHIVTGGFVALV